MKPLYRPPFVSFVEKQHRPLRLAIRDAVDEICAHPETGEPKAGDLQGARVHKFTHRRQQYLMAYRPPSVEVIASVVDLEILYIEFYQVGVHENFYADLKHYLKSRGAIEPY